MIKPSVLVRKRMPQHIIGLQTSLLVNKLNSSNSIVKRLFTGSNWMSRSRSHGGGICNRNIQCKKYFSTGSLQSVGERSERKRREEFSSHWHFWNFVMSITPAIGVWYYLHFVVRKDMLETAVNLKNKHDKDGAAVKDNSIRGRRNKRNNDIKHENMLLSSEEKIQDVENTNIQLQEKINVLEQKINDIVKELNSSTNSKTEQDDNNKKLKVKDAVAKEGEKS